MSPQAIALAGVVVFLIAAYRFDVYCLNDLAEAHTVLCFPPQTWTYIIIFATPLGGIAYLTIGRPS